MRLAFRLLSAVHNAVYRVTRGRALGHLGPLGVLLLSTTGRTSGRQRTVPLLFTPAGDGFAVVASKGGAPRNPAWCDNLLAHPDATVEIRGERIAVRAREAEGDERDRLWRAMTDGYAGYDDYQQKTARRIPVFVLERRN